MMVGRAQETIAISADLKAHALPAIDALGATDGVRSALAKRCLAPAFRIAIAVWAFPLEAFSFHG
jgi:hypothetical protein